MDVIKSIFNVIAFIGGFVFVCAVLTALGAFGSVIFGLICFCWVISLLGKKK
jgi:hypothetical protein